MGFKIEGVADFQDKLNKIRSSVPKALTTVMSEFVLKVQNEAMKRTPVDTGNLRSSYRTMVSQLPKRGVVGRVVNKAEYATYVHERTELRHDVGEAKFLHNAVMEKRHELRNKLGMALHYQLFKGKLI
jgi:hypothetical protein